MVFTESLLCKSVPRFDSQTLLYYFTRIQLKIFRISFINGINFVIFFHHSTSNISRYILALLFDAFRSNNKTIRAITAVINQLTKITLDSFRLIFDDWLFSGATKRSLFNNFLSLSVSLFFLFGFFLSFLSWSFESVAPWTCDYRWWRYRRRTRLR